MIDIATLTSLIGIMLSFLFGYRGRPWYYIFLSMFAAWLIGFILNPVGTIEQALMGGVFFGLGVFIPVLGAIAAAFWVLPMLLSVVMHLIVWFIGSKIGGRRD